MGRSRSSALALQRGRITPGQQMRVGIFAVLALAGIIGVYLLLSNFVLSSRGYQIAVHFRNVGGLQVGNTVQLAGVSIGVVKTVELLPDQTVDVICTIDPGVTVYRESQFTVSATITGQTTLTIVPPAQLATATPLTGILPEDQQPWGGIPPSIADLVTAIEPRIKDLDKTLAIIDRQLPLLTERFASMAGHTDRLVVNANANLNRLTQQMGGTLVALDAAIQSTQGVIGATGRNMVALTGSLNETVQGNQGKINQLTANLASAAGNLNQTMATMASIAKDPQLKGNFIQTTANLRDASEKMKKIAGDLESITGDPSVQANLKGAVYDLSSTIAKANDILGNYSTATAHGPAPVGATPVPATSGAPHRLGRFSVGTIVQAQIRETWRATGQGAGPQSDLNLQFLPGARTGLTLGANDLGHNTSYNFLLNKRLTPQFTISGGVLYSNLGLEAQFQPVRPLGFDARLYDPVNPKLDLYGDLNLARRLQLFYGQRNIFNAPNRFGPSTSTPALGFQTTY